MTTNNFKVGDRVRLTGASWSALSGAKVGDIVTISGVDPDGDPIFEASSTEYFIYGDYTAELIEAEDATPNPSEYNDSTNENLRRHIASQDAIIRKRNETIVKQREQLTEYARRLEERQGVLSALDQAARQLGLGTEEAAKALELGARFLAHGYTAKDADFWIRIDRFFQHRIAARKDAA